MNTPGAPAVPARRFSGIPWLLLRRGALRHWRLAPGQSLLLLLILALGVGVFLSVRLANRAAVASFRNFTAVLAGESDLLVQSPAGRLDVALLPELLFALAPVNADLLPVVESSAVLAVEPAGDGRRFGRATLRLLGVDLVALSNLTVRAGGGGLFAAQSDRSPAAGRAAFWRALQSGRSAFTSAELAAALDLRVGEPWSVVVGDRTVELEFAGTIPRVPDRPAPAPNLVVLDLPTLQSLLGQPTRVDRVEIVLPEGGRTTERLAAARTALEAAAAGRWSVQTPGEQRDAAATMTRAFRLNLTVLSLIALLVGVYLVFQALEAAVVRRRAEIATLRSLGVSARTIRQTWLVEAAALGVLGGILGIALGWLGAQVAVRFVGQTVNALYFETTVRAAHLARAEALWALAAALALSVVAGWWPARAAAQTPPAQALGRAGAAPIRPVRLRRNCAIGLALLALGTVCAQLPPWPLAAGGGLPLGGYAAAFLWLAGAGLVAGAAFPAAAHLGTAWGRRWLPALLAASQVRRPGARHCLAAASLVCAVAMTAGMTILVASFETTIRAWIAHTLQSDLYLSSRAAQGAGNDARIAEATWRAIVARPEVARAGVQQAFAVTLGGRSTTVSGGDLAFFREESDIPWPQPVDAALYSKSGDGITAPVAGFASESFATRFSVRRGTVVDIPTPAGPRAVLVAGVFADYGNERGSLLVPWERTSAWWGDAQASTIALRLVPGADAEALRAALEEAHPGLSIFTYAHLRGEILRIFRQTFAITYALQGIGVAVALGGLALTLIGMLLERRDQLTTQRALGMSRLEMAAAMASEGALVGAVGTGGGLAASLALGWLLIFVINQQSFGWTLQLVWPTGQLALLSAAVVGCGAAVSYAVGRWGADLPAEREQ